MKNLLGRFVGFIGLVAVALVGFGIMVGQVSAQVPGVTPTITKLAAYAIGVTNGHPGDTYLIQSATDITGVGNWRAIGVVTVDANGFASVTNIPDQSFGQNFYRLRFASVALLSLDSSTPLIGTVPVNDTVNEQYLGLPVLVFDINAQNDNLHQRRIVADFNVSGTGSLGAAYLYQGSVQVSSASVSNGKAVFDNIVDGTVGAVIPKSTTLAYTVKVDVSGVTPGNSLNITASIHSTNQVVMDSFSGVASVIGDAAGYPITVAGSGPIFSLVGTPSMVKTFVSSDYAGNTTFSYQATFNVSVMAVGQDVTLGLPSSASPAFPMNTNFVAVYRNGIVDTTTDYTHGGLVTTGIYYLPTGTTLSADGTQFTVARNQMIVVPVTYAFNVMNPGSATYALQLNAIRWMSSDAAVHVMQVGDIHWRTPNL